MLNTDLITVPMGKCPIRALRSAQDPRLAAGRGACRIARIFACFVRSHIISVTPSPVFYRFPITCRWNAPSITVTITPVHPCPHKISWEPRGKLRSGANQPLNATSFRLVRSVIHLSVIQERFERFVDILFILNVEVNEKCRTLSIVLRGCHSLVLDVVVACAPQHLPPQPMILCFKCSILIDQYAYFSFVFVNLAARFFCCFIRLHWYLSFGIRKQSMAGNAITLNCEPTKLLLHLPSYCKRFHAIMAFFG